MLGFAMRRVLVQTLAGVEATLGIAFAVLSRLALFIAAAVILVVWVAVVLLLTGRMPLAVRRYL